MTAAASRLLLVEVFVRFVLFLTGLVYLCKVNCSVFFLFFCVYVCFSWLLFICFLLSV